MRSWAIELSVALQVKHQGKTFVNSLHLLKGEESGAIGEAVQVNCGDLVAHHQGAVTGDFDIGSEGGLSSAGAGERDDPGAEGKPIRLQDHGIPATLLLVPLPAGGQPVDLAPHDVSCSAARSS